MKRAKQGEGKGPRRKLVKALFVHVYAQMQEVVDETQGKEVVDGSHENLFQ